MHRLTLLLLMLAVPAGAATIQQDFDAAQALREAGKTDAARQAFGALLARFAPDSKSRASHLVRTRLASAMLATGEYQAAEPLLTVAIAGLGGAADAPDRALALQDRGIAREQMGRIDAAAADFAAMLASKAFPANSVEEIYSRAALARTVIWSDPATARRLLDELLALPPQYFGKATDQRALLETLRGRVELNNGDPEAARRWFLRAASSAGGAETQSLTVADVRIRGDLALASFQLGRLDEVQKYMAFSGAGGLQAEGLDMPAGMSLPACAPATGLAPDATAIIEFSISDDGRVRQVTPVFASTGSGKRVAGVTDQGPETLFAEAVKSWFWDATRIGKPFWRQAVRAELRCFTARPDADPVSRSFDADHIAWSAARGIAPLPELPDQDTLALPLLRAEVTRREAAHGTTSVQLIAPYRGIAANLAAPAAERSAAWKRYLDLVETAQPSAAVLGSARIFDARQAAYTRATRIDSARVIRDRMVAQVASLEAGSEGNSRIAHWTRLELAQAFETLREVERSRALLDRIVAATDVIADGDPIRTAALLRLSNQAAAARDLVAAQQAMDASGLSAEQCALVDVRPQPIAASFSDRDFPEEARRWGSSGLVRFAYDITAEGKTTNIRTIFALPPLVFDKAAESRARQFRYQPVFRPGNTIGCTGSSQNVRFRMIN